MIRLAVLLGYLALFPAGLAAQIINPDDSQSGVLEAFLPLNFSITSLLRASEGFDTLWRPDWPPDLPPDLFSAGPAALSIRADFEDGRSLEFSRDINGRVFLFPFLTSFPGDGETSAPTADVSGVNRTVFFQGRGEFDREGKLIRLFWEEPRVSDNQSAGENHLEILQWDIENRPVLCRIFTGNYYFIALEYLGQSIIETWYDQNGSALFAIINENSKQTFNNMVIEFSRNNQGSISRIEYSLQNDALITLSLSAIYNAYGRPQSLVISGSEQILYSLQWDGAGFLNRLLGVRLPESEYFLDCRYEYNIDYRENWTERIEYFMVPINPGNERLVPGEIRKIQRFIRYE